MEIPRYPMHNGFRAAACGRAGSRYNGNSTLRTKDGVGSKGSTPFNDSMVVVEPDTVNDPKRGGLIW